MKPPLLAVALLTASCTPSCLAVALIAADSALTADTPQGKMARLDWDRMQSVPRPTQEEIAATQIGEPPSEEAARLAGETLIKAQIPAPSTVLVSSVPLRRWWYQHKTGRIVIAWELRTRVDAQVSARHTYYRHHKTWNFYFRDGRMVAWWPVGSRLVEVK